MYYGCIDNGLTRIYYIKTPDTRWYLQPMTRLCQRAFWTLPADSTFRQSKHKRTCNEKNAHYFFVVEGSLAESVQNLQFLLIHDHKVGTVRVQYIGVSRGAAFLMC